jgi:hypothetical protein
MNSFVKILLWIGILGIFAITIWFIWPHLAVEKESVILGDKDLLAEIQKTHIDFLKGYLEFDPTIFKEYVAANYTVINHATNKVFVLSSAEVEQLENYFMSHVSPYRGYSVNDVINADEIEIYNWDRIPEDIGGLLLNYSVSPEEFLATVPIKTASILEKPMFGAKVWMQIYRKIDGKWMAVAGDLI